MVAKKKRAATSKNSEIFAVYERLSFEERRAFVLSNRVSEYTANFIQSIVYGLSGLENALFIEDYLGANAVALLKLDFGNIKMFGRFAQEFVEDHPEWRYVINAAQTGVERFKIAPQKDLELAFRIHELRTKKKTWGQIEKETKKGKEHARLIFKRHAKFLKDVENEIQRVQRENDTNFRDLIIRFGLRGTK